jgi:outer membrane protein
MIRFRSVAVLSALALVVGPAVATAQESLPLEEAVRRALASHPAVGAAAARSQGAEALGGVARSAWYPSLSVSASGTRFQEPMLVAPLHGFEFTTPPEFDRTLVRGDVDVAWTLFEGGARSSRVEAADARAGSAAARVGAARQDLAARVVGSYVQLLSRREARAAQRARLEALLAERDRVNRLLAEGRAPEVERFRAEAAIARAEADLAELDAAILAGTHELARLVGVEGGVLPVERLRTVALRTPDPDAPVAEPPDASEPGPPELVAARSELRAAEAERDVASAAWLPRLLLSGGLRSYGSSGGEFTAEWQAGVGLEYPLFTGFARSRRVAAASAAETAAREDLRVAELAVADRADRALEAVRGAAASAEALAIAERHQAEVVRIERLSLAEGAGVQTDYLRAEAELAETRAARARAMNLHVAARAELARARGELTPDWIRRNLESLP